MTAPQSTPSISGRDWRAIVAGFAGAFLVGMAATGEGSGLKLLLMLLGLGLLVVAVGLAVVSIRERRDEAAERTDWEAFERALDEGIRFKVPDGMGYAASLPAVLDDLADVGQPADGQALHAIVGEEGEIHWCAFQHQRAGGTATVGMVGLHPERDADTYPHLQIRVAEPQAADFDSRFEVTADDPVFALAVLNDPARRELMAVEPFGWRVEGNQIITSSEQPSTPEEAIGFIESRVKPLARVAGQIPFDA